jgi:hypothetical protein
MRYRGAGPLAVAVAAAAAAAEDDAEPAAVAVVVLVVASFWAARIKSKKASPNVVLPRSV